MSTGGAFIQVVASTTASAADVWTAKDYATVISPLGSAAVGIVALIVSAVMTTKTLRVSQLNNEATIWQKANELEVKEIQDKLDRFYGPYSQMSGTNALLSRDLRSRQQDSSTFLLIEKLFDKSWLESLPTDQKALVGELVTNAGNMRKFILDNAKMADAKIQPYLSRVCAHYRILELAHAGQLGTDPKPYVSKYVFPIQIEKVLALEVARLESRKQHLRSQPSKQPPMIGELLIPEDLKLPEWQYPKRQHRDGLNMPIVDKEQPGASK
ncbi:hypothetical protein [Bradyrhizobium sp. 164]|uniref:hypothetical protein n=1 Tax=Bradyrhizobium sp. 164 TaxID=2782637 RepID=UPI001FFA2F38|nr:hypothetical protein [Bradyrhizobium sp. 164]MCK1593340.1 hypothetical protein [Bradyrhizobium sp. 164]